MGSKNKGNKTLTAALLMSVPIIWLKKKANGLINKGEFKFIPVGAKPGLTV